MRNLLTIINILCLLQIDISANAFDFNSAAGWRAGVAREVITPEQPIWMAGYTSRKHPATGTMIDLWAKALALEDASGNRTVLITTDLEEISKGMSDGIRDQLKLKYNLSKDQIILNCSHTHSSPIIKSITCFYTYDSAQVARVNQYSDDLESKIISIVGIALNSFEPVQLFSQNGVVRFQVNRRNNIEYKLPLKTNFNGPNDYAVPVIKVADKTGQIIAIVFGYACHNSVLSGYDWSGDYAGFAQLELERLYPNSTALFFQGAGGNQIAYPRKTIAAAQQHGKSLAAAVERVLNEEMKLLSPKLVCAYSEIELPISKSPNIEAFKKMADDSSLDEDVRRWAKALVDSFRVGKPLKTFYPYPVQVWRIGEQVLFSLGGELVVEYALKLKKIFGQDVFVAGYCNDVMAYIPTAAILNEGGYEPVSSLTSCSGFLPAPWDVRIEPMIIEEVLRLAKKTGIPLYYPAALTN
ncbi:MAG: neutral/alkaline non-lysosomal ceramidase N-terminal domain-containing protein [Ginsengibacter sp.]